MKQQLSRRTYTLQMSDLNPIGEMEAFILAGGASRRMGAFKAMLTVEGATMLERVSRALRAARSVSVVVREDVEDKLTTALPRVRDVRDVRCALSGLHAALTHARSEWICVVACDYPFVRAELFARLANMCDEQIEAVVPYNLEAKAQTLCALYRREKCSHAINEMYDEPDLRLENLLSRIAIRKVEFTEIEDLAGAQKFFLNLNTPRDLAAAQSTNGETT